MRETIELGSSPSDEEPAQVGTPGYDRRALVECQAYINQLKRVYRGGHGGAPIPNGARLRIKSNPHDFGTYYEVAVTFPDDDKKAVEAAFWLDEHAPQTWDEEAQQELSSSV